LDDVTRHPAFRNPTTTLFRLKKFKFRHCGPYATPAAAGASGLPHIPRADRATASAVPHASRFVDEERDFAHFLNAVS